MGNASGLGFFSHTCPPNVLGSLFRAHEKDVIPCQSDVGKTTSPLSHRPPGFYSLERGSHHPGRNCSVSFTPRSAGMGTCGHLTSARDTTAIVCTVRSFTYTRPVLLIYLLYSLFARVYATAVPSSNIDLVPPKSTTFLTQLLRLINGLNAVICGKNFARFRPIDGTVDEVNQHRDDFINIADQLSGRVAFPSKAVAVEKSDPGPLASTAA